MTTEGERGPCINLTWSGNISNIWDIGAITSLFALSNRMAHLASIRPNDEFFTMGR